MSNQIEEDNDLLGAKAHQVGDSLQNLAQKQKKRKLQITFEDIKIVAMPPTGRCKGRNALKEPKTIIDGVSGTILPGQFLAIIGASGAGKTTLLNFLSGREISQNLEKTGSIRVNGVEKKDIASFSSLSAYVQQDDILFQTMSVRECLEFAAKLKLPGTYEEKMGRVNEVISELKLVKCQNTKIGGPLVKGVSGGERKRTSIGVELITDPSLIFLDEPTTGLDSFTATSVMETLGELARKDGRTVISTIHQPNSDIFEMFDRLMLLAKGKIIYLNEARLAVDYFGSIGFQCPDLSNPADFFMTMMSIESIELDTAASAAGSVTMDPKRIQEEYQRTIQLFDTKYKNSDLVNDHLYEHPECAPIGSTDDVNVVETGFCYQWGLLARRNFMNLLRLPQTSYVKLITTVLTACFACLLFFNTSMDRQGVMNVQGALFFITMNISFNAIQNVILIFPDERPVFLREVNNNMYKTGPYFWAKVISELPFSILTPTIFGSIVYYLIGLNPGASRFGTFLLILILAYNASSGYSLIISASFSDKQLAVTLTPVLIIPFMLFAGFFVSASNIPWFLKEFEYLSIFKYGYQALMRNQFGELCPSGKCDADDAQCIADNQALYDSTLDMNYRYACCWQGYDPEITAANACDPFSQIAEWPGLTGSMGMLFGIYVTCYMFAWMILSCLSNKYE